MSTDSDDHASTAVEAISENEDLLTLLLSHLPARPLLRFKSVSKKWLSLISDRRFSHLHSRRRWNPSGSAVLFFHRSLSSPTSFPSFDFIPLRAHGNRSSLPPPFFSNLESSSLTILQSCNGLLLLCCLDPSANDPDVSYYVCNPTINLTSPIPLPDAILSRDQSILGINLAFDPNQSADYKLICVWKSISDEIHHGVDVYSTRTNHWKRSTVCHSGMLPFDLEFERGVYCGGKIHWLSHTDSSVFFDLESEMIKPLALPPPIEGVYIERFRYLGESQGHLHLVEIRTNSVSEFNVLELENETLTWSVKYRVNLDVVGRQFDEMFQNYNDRFGRRFRFYAFSILAVVREERQEDTTLVLSIPGKVISYNFETGSTDLLCEVGDQTDRWLPFKGYNAYQFIESLYCI